MAGQGLGVAEYHARPSVCETPREPHKRYDTASLQLRNLVKGSRCQKAVRHPFQRFSDLTRRSVEEGRALPVPAVGRGGVAEQPEWVQLKSVTAGLVIRRANDLYPSEH